MDYTARVLADRASHNPMYRRSRMGEGAYAPASSDQPLGWDYDTLVTALTDMGYPTLDEEMSPEFMDKLILELEGEHATSTNHVDQVIMEALEGSDPYNEFAGHLPAWTEDSPGYWDAENRGNRKGSSFLASPQGRDDPTYSAADPVGNGPYKWLLDTDLMEYQFKKGLRDLDPADMAEVLGGDLDPIEHLLQRDDAYDRAYQADDDDARAEAGDAFINSPKGQAIIREFLNNHIPPTREEGYTPGMLRVYDNR